MKSFLVFYDRLSMLMENDVLKKIEMQRLHDLMREKILIRSFLSKEQDKIWLYFQINDRSSLEDVLKTLPSCSKMEAYITELLE